jgi:rubrerythrin
MTETNIDNVAELLAHAYQMEVEAQERYEFLADQMELHNNRELVGLFGKLAHIEGLHATELRERMAGMDIPYINELDFEWSTAESPEAIDMGDVHYMLTERQALLLALRAEENAAKFFSDLLAIAKDPEFKRFAAEFAEEEREHVELIQKELNKHREEDEQSLDDMDPPIAQG